MNDFHVFSYTHDDLSRLPTRPVDSSKGTFGRVLCVCGSRGMAGAAYLAALSALRIGAGLVEILTPEENRVILQTLLPEAIVTPYRSDEPESLVIEAALRRASSVVCGCGLGTTAQARFVLSRVLRSADVPTVLDADALNLISRNRALLKYAEGKIITPHPLEMSRLIGLDVTEIQSDRTSVCHDFAKDHGLVCILKGHAPVVSDGTPHIYINNSGNSGMATAGAGDVLAGIIGGLLAQSQLSNLSMFETAAHGVYIHGLAGDVAASKLSEYSVIASDIIDNLPAILKKAVVG